MSWIYIVSREGVGIKRGRETHLVLILLYIAQGEAIQAYLLEKTGQRTVPNVFVNKTHIGGSDDLAKAERDGTLQKLLAQ